MDRVGDALIIGRRAMRLVAEGQLWTTFFYITSGAGVPYVLEKILASAPAGRLKRVVDEHGAATVELFAGTADQPAWRGGDDERDFARVVRAAMPAATDAEVAYFVRCYDGPHEPVLSFTPV